MTFHVIATLATRPQNIPQILDALKSQVYPADHAWLMFEDETVAQAAMDSMWNVHPNGLTTYHTRIVPTPTDQQGRWSLIPYALKINAALDEIAGLADEGERTRIAYLTDDSVPAPRKFYAMEAGLGEHDVVYVPQDYEDGRVRFPAGPVQDAHGILDHTQVAHVLSDDRWPIDVAHMQLGDAEMWRALHRRFGPFYPVGEQGEPLDYVRQTKDGISATWR